MGFAIGTTAWRETNWDRWRLFEKMKAGAQREVGNQPYSPRCGGIGWPLV